MELDNVKLMNRILYYEYFYSTGSSRKDSFEKSYLKTTAGR